MPEPRSRSLLRGSMQPSPQVRRTRHRAVAIATAPGRLLWRALCSAHLDIRLELPIPGDLGLHVRYVRSGDSQTCPLQVGCFARDRCWVRSSDKPAAVQDTSQAGSESPPEAESLIAKDAGLADCGAAPDSRATSTGVCSRPAHGSRAVLATHLQSVTNGAVRQVRPQEAELVSAGHRPSTQGNNTRSQPQPGTRLSRRGHCEPLARLHERIRAG